MRLRRLPIAALLLAGCAGAHRLATLKDPRAEGYFVLGGVALEPGAKPYDCGPEAITALLRAAGDLDLTVEQATTRLYDERRKGTLSVDLVPFVRERGYRPVLVPDANLAVLKDHLQARRPLLAMLDVATFPRPALEAYRPQGLHHFFIVTGFNDRKEEVVCEWYGGKKALIAYREFVPAWEKDGRFLMYVDRETAESLVQAGRQFAGRGSAERARGCWERALALDPGCVPARLQLGSLSFREGKTAEAVDQFLKAVEAEPLNPEALNDLAYARSVAGDAGDEVAAMARRAVARYEEEIARAASALEAQRATLGAADRIAAENELSARRTDLTSARDTLAGILEARGDAPGTIAAAESALAGATQERNPDGQEPGPGRDEFRARQHLRIARAAVATGDGERAGRALRAAEKLARTKAQWEEIDALKARLR